MFLRTEPQTTPAQRQDKATNHDTEQAPKSSTQPLGGTPISDKSDGSVLMTVPRHTPANRHQREAQQRRFESCYLQVSDPFRKPGVGHNAHLITITTASSPSSFSIIWAG